MKISEFLANTQLKFAIVVLDSVLGPQGLVGHTWQCACISVSPEATHESRALGTMSAQKAHQWSETETRELLGGSTENSVS